VVRCEWDSSHGCAAVFPARSAAARGSIPCCWSSPRRSVGEQRLVVVAACRSVTASSSESARRPSLFTSPAMRGAHRFALTAGGCGLTQRDHVAYAQTLCAVERETAQGGTGVGRITAAFPSAHGFLTAERHEQNRVLATRLWMHVPVKISGRTFSYYYRDVMQVVLGSLAGADTVSLGVVPSAAADAAAAHPDGYETRADHVRRGTLDADLYVDERRAVRRIHGREARVAGVQLHADEALVSCSGAHKMFPLRVNVVNVLDNGGQW